MQLHVSAHLYDHYQAVHAILISALDGHIWSVLFAGESHWCLAERRLGGLQW